MLDLTQLPGEVRDKIAELDLELSEGDITQKGYEKKKAKLLAPFLPQLQAQSNQAIAAAVNIAFERNDSGLSSTSGGGIIGGAIATPQHRPHRDQVTAGSFVSPVAVALPPTNNQHAYGVYAQAGSSAAPTQIGSASPSSRAKRRAHRRVTRHESRYHSEVRQEAVQQALAAMKNKPKPALPMPSKRSTAHARPGATGGGGGVASSGDVHRRIVNRRLIAHRNGNSSHGHGTADDSFTSSDDDTLDDDDDTESIGGLPRSNRSGNRREAAESALRKLQIHSSNAPSYKLTSGPVSSSVTGLASHHKQSYHPLHSSHPSQLPPTSYNSSQQRQRQNSSDGSSSSSAVHEPKYVNKQQQPLPSVPSRENRAVYSNEGAEILNNRAKNERLSGPASSSRVKPLQSVTQQPDTPQRSRAITVEPIRPASLRIEDRPLPPKPDESTSSSERPPLSSSSSSQQPALPPHRHRLTTADVDSGAEEAPLPPPHRITSRVDPSSLRTEPTFSSPELVEPLSIAITANVARSRSYSNTTSSSQTHCSGDIETEIQAEYDQVYGDQSQITTATGDPSICSETHSIEPGSELSGGTQSPSNQSRLSSQSFETFNSGTGKWKVSAKIQQLLNTLKRPKKRALDEFYKDDEYELEMPPPDPAAPKPEGCTMSPVHGEPLLVPSGLPVSLEAALQRYGSATFKAQAVSVLESNGKLSSALTYGKLLSRSRKIAYNLLNRVGSSRRSGGTVSGLGSAVGTGTGSIGSASSGATTGSFETAAVGELPIKPGDRVALVFPNSDPIGFICAFYGCLTAGVVPVPVEVPLSRRDAGSQQIGFLLGSCNVNYALSSEACVKGLPKEVNGQVAQFKGWPRLAWLVSANWPKAPKDWQPPPRVLDDSCAYIEYTVDREGSVKGVAVSRSAMLSHCRALTGACAYTEGDVLVCLLDFKKECGLWHAVLTSVLSGMHVIHIPYAQMKAGPSVWLQLVSRMKATVALCKSRDLHWTLLAARDQKDVHLGSLRMLLVADGANPWSLSSCDQFLSTFHARGLRPDALCPCAVSTEAMSVAIRRPGRTGIGATGRGVLSMSALSHGVIRVEQENSLTSLTLQDCGHVLPGCQVVVVELTAPQSAYSNNSLNNSGASAATAPSTAPAKLCKSDQVGEICIQSFASQCTYRGLAGLSQSVFRLQITDPDHNQLLSGRYVRTGLLGFVGPGGLVFVCGTRDGLLQVAGRKHNADDLIATVLAVQPMKFVYRGRIAVFSCRVLRDERVCVVAEQRPDCSEEQSFQWMSRVLQAVDSIHQVGVYCLALLPPNCLPRGALGGVHVAEVKRRLLAGQLHPANVLMCPHACVHNLPRPRESQPEIGPAAVMVGNIVQGNRLAVAQGRSLTPAEQRDDPNDPNELTTFIGELLRSRAVNTPNHNLFTLLNEKGAEQSTLSCAALYRKAEKIACLLLEKGKLNTGDHVALLFPPGIELIAALFACFYVGVVPVPIRPPSPTALAAQLPAVKLTIASSRCVLLLSTITLLKLLKSREALAQLENRPLDIRTLDIEHLPHKKLTSVYRPPTAEMLAYLDFSVSTTGLLAGVKISHAAVSSVCRSLKLACELYPSRHVALCLDPYSGLGFVLWCLSSVYAGHHSILISPNDLQTNPGLWLSALSQYKVRDTFCSYSVLELCTKELASSIAQYKVYFIFSV